MISAGRKLFLREIAQVKHPIYLAQQKRLFFNGVSARCPNTFEKSQQKGLALDSIIGRVHSIETFSAIDGPGIRYMLFLQGCNLKCMSCSNRDTWDLAGGKEMTVQQVVDHMLRYKTYIQGITVSGGEALLQPHFVAALFEAAHQHGINTCLDTAGQSPKQNWDIVLPHTDLALVCIKHTNPTKYHTFTGIKQKVSLEFVEKLAFEYGVPFYLRYLYIPGFSDDAAEVEHFLTYAARFRPLLRGIELLPYHRLGVEKWKAQVGFVPGCCKRHRTRPLSSKQPNRRMQANLCSREMHPLRT